MTNLKPGIAIMVSNSELCGLMSGGDLRRALLKKINLYRALEKEILSIDLLAIAENSVHSEAEQVVKYCQVKCILVLNLNILLWLVTLSFMFNS